VKTSSVEKEVQNSTNGGKDVVGTFLVCIRASFGTLLREGHSSKQCPL
jgi:hypothetical protein